jgi:hypothetical protein
VWYPNFRLVFVWVETKVRISLRYSLEGETIWNGRDVFRVPDVLWELLNNILETVTGTC